MQPKIWKLWSSTSKWKSWGSTKKWKCCRNSKKRKPAQTESRKPPWIISTVNSEWQYIQLSKDLLERCPLKYADKWKPGTSPNPSKWKLWAGKIWVVVSQDSVQGSRGSVGWNPNTVQGSIGWKQDFAAWAQTEADYWCWYNCQRKRGRIPWPPFIYVTLLKNICKVATIARQASGHITMNISEDPDIRCHI